MPRKRQDGPEASGNPGPRPQTRQQGPAKPKRRGDYTNPRPKTQEKIAAAAMQALKNKLGIGPKVDPLKVAGLKNTQNQTAQHFRDAYKRRLADELENAGLTLPVLAQRIEEGTRAEEVRLASFEGKFTDERKVPEWKARTRNNELAALIYNQVPGRRDENFDPSPVFAIQVVFGGLPPAPHAGNGIPFQVDVTPPRSMPPAP